MQVAEVFTNNPGMLVPIEQTISGFKEILDGKYDHLPEVAFYMVGNIDEVSFSSTDGANYFFRTSRTRSYFVVIKNEV